MKNGNSKKLNTGTPIHPRNSQDLNSGTRKKRLTSPHYPGFLIKECCSYYQLEDREEVLEFCNYEFFGQITFIYCCHIFDTHPPLCRPNFSKCQTIFTNFSLNKCGYGRKKLRVCVVKSPEWTNEYTTCYRTRA